MGQRPQRLVRAESEPEFERRLQRAAERADPFMAFLGVMFALLVGFELAVDLEPPTARVFMAIAWAVWALFLLEFLVELYLAPNRLGFLRLARLGRALPAARVLSSSYRVTGTAAKVFRSRLGYLGALTAVTIVVVGEVAFVFERDARDGGAFDHLGDALLWSAGVVLGQQGDPVPASIGGRLAMIAGFGFGVVVLAALAGALGSLFVEQRNERAAGAADAA